MRPLCHYYYSGSIPERLSPRNIYILTRVSDIVLMAIVAQLLFRGTIELAVDVGLIRLLTNVGS